MTADRRSATARRLGYWSVTTGLALALMLAPDPTWASGIGVPQLGGGAASVTGTTPGSIYMNPALLADMRGLQMAIDLGGVLAMADYQRERRASYQFADGFEFALPVYPAAIDPAKSGFAPAVSATEILPGVALALSHDLGDRVTFGLAVHPSFGAPLNFPLQGPQRWALQEVFLMGVYGTPALAVKATDWLWLGAGFDIVFGIMSLRQVVDLATTPFLAEAFANPPIGQPNDFGSDAPSAVRELDVLSRPVTIVGATAWGMSFKAGMVIAPSPDWRFALAWQHRADLVFQGDAYLDMNHDFFTGDLASQGLHYPALVKGTAWIELPLPASLRAGLSWQATAAWRLQLQTAWVHYSAVERLDVTLQSPDLAQPQLGIGDATAFSLPRRWMDTVEVEGVVDWLSSASLRWSLRAGYHSPMSPDATMDLISIDGHRLLGGLMARWQSTGWLALSGQVAVHHLLERRVVASDYDRANGIYGLTLLVFGGSVEFAL